jgi:hypothetical protein
MKRRHFLSLAALGTSLVSVLGVHSCLVNLIEDK